MRKALRLAEAQLRYGSADDKVVAVAMADGLNKAVQIIDRFTKVSEE